MKINIKTAILFLISLLVFTNHTVFAHSYHYELQVSNTLKTNEKKQLEALKLSFTYDGETSDVMLQDQKDLNKLGGKLTSDLGKLAYFTQAKVDGKVLSFNKATNIKLEKVNIKDKEGSYDVLKLNFTLPLKKPVNIANSKIGLFHEDPTSVAIIYYNDAKQILLGDSLKNNCSPSVKEKEKFEEGEFPQVVSVSCKS